MELDEKTTMILKEKIKKLERAWRTLDELRKAIKKQVDASDELLEMSEGTLLANKRQFDFRYLRQTTEELRGWLDTQDELNGEKK
jgi:hypothetical protein